MKKILALVLVMMMVLVSAAFAAGDPSITIESNATEADKVNTEGTVYTYWKILDASIDTDPTVNSADGSSKDGVVAYYVTTEAAKTAIEGTGLFNVAQVGDTQKWYVELKDKNTKAQDIIDELNKLTEDQLTAAFGAPKTMTMADGTASSGKVDPGYYFIKSTLGSKIAIQTLSPVTIKEKNEYVTDDKTVPTTDENSQIGQEITYTLTVNVPVTANDQIVLTDTMSKGLTFKEIKSQSPIEGTASTVSAADAGATKFTITYSAEQIQNLVKDKTETQTITVEVVVIVNEEAAIDTNIPNTLDLKYGNNFESKPVTVNTKTTKFDFDKIDGTDKTTKLPGAEFQLLLNSTAVKLVKVEDGKTYRVATAAEITAAGADLTDTIVTNGNMVTINGLDGDLTYQLKETKAPTGYNIMDPDTITITPENSAFVHQSIENNKGAQLPSTGGVGTTIFYVAGSILVLAAAVLLVTKRRMGNND